LAAEVSEGRFREELLYRINVITIRLPALRERKEDITLLGNHFLRKYEKPLGRSPMRFSKGAMRLLMNYRWPGNVRELENTIERAAILAETDVIHTHDLPEKLHDALPANGNESGTPGMTLEELEREHLRRVLSQVKGDKVKAAQLLGIHLSTLYRKVQRYRLDIESRPPATKPAAHAV
jgi:DNA-binding NtrC family response regulator